MLLCLKIPRNLGIKDITSVSLSYWSTCICQVLQLMKELVINFTLDEFFGNRTHTGKLATTAGD